MDFILDIDLQSCGSASHHAISSLILRRRHTVESDDGGNITTVAIVDEVGNAIISTLEYISYLDLGARRADERCAVGTIDLERISNTAPPEPDIRFLIG